MGNDFKAEARKQYFSYFKFWFGAAIILLVVAACCVVYFITDMKRTRTNMEAPTERVFDSADVLTTEQEQELREYIALGEQIAKCDIVLVTINRPVEGPEIVNMGYRYDDWELNMRDLADDFYDENHFGFNKGFEGDGVLLLDNWYEGQAGSLLSTSGKVFDNMGDYEINALLDDVYDYIEYDIVEAYKAYVDYIVNLMSGGQEKLAMAGTSFIGSLVISAIAALIFVASKLHYKAGDVTVTSSTYIDGNERVKERRDTFIRKDTSRRRRPQNTGGSSGSGSSHSRGGSHRSSSGARHGGGGRRR